MFYCDMFYHNSFSFIVSHSFSSTVYEPVWLPFATLVEHQPIFHGYLPNHL